MKNNRLTDIIAAAREMAHADLEGNHELAQRIDDAFGKDYAGVLDALKIFNAEYKRAIAEER